MTDERLAELELLVRVLSAGLGLEEPLEAIPSTVLDHLDRGEDVKAVKAMRTDTTGRLGLLDAKRMVDAVKRHLAEPT